MINRRRINEIRVRRGRIERKERAMARAGLLACAGSLFGAHIGEYEDGEEIIDTTGDTLDELSKEISEERERVEELEMQLGWFESLYLRYAGGQHD